MGHYKLIKMTNLQKQALREKIDEIIAEAQSNSQSAIEGKAAEAMAMIPPDDDDGDDPQP